MSIHERVFHVKEYKSKEITYSNAILLSDNVTLQIKKKKKRISNIIFPPL